MRHKLLRVLQLIKILPFLNLQIKKKINGKVFKIPVLGSSIGFENLNMHETWMIMIIQKILNNQILISNREDAVFIDIGANIGQTLLKLKSINNKIDSLDYYGFEPNSTCVDYLHKLIYLNKFDRVNIIPIGIGEVTKIENLFADNMFASGASVIRDFRKNQNIKYVFNIPIFNGTDALGSIKRKIGIIKIDVEGFEDSVINGLSKRIIDDRPIIICEVLPNYGNLESPRYMRQLKLEESLINFNYNIFRINESNYKLIHLVKIGQTFSMDETNYLFIPKEMQISVDDF